MKIKIKDFEYDINFNVIQSIVKRDLWLYFTNPTGYVFITAFIFLTAFFAFWQDRFFLNNLANLDQLNTWFPFILVLFIPALTMSVWAEENKQGTDELLLTLPATDLEVVFGKYLATLGIYTASLILSFFSHVLILAWLGSPDLGLIIGNYIGYWFSGGALIAVGMLASLLTANATIAFILGALFCGLMVFFGSAAGLLSQGLQDLVASLGVFDHFQDFTRGILSFSGILYFISVTGIALYLNILLIGRRHWPLEADGYKMSLHHSLRTVAIIIGVISLNVIIARASVRVDVTAEQLHSLSKETKEILKEIPEDRPVFIEAFISEEVPRQYVQTRTNLLSFLEEMDKVGGPRIQVYIHDTEPYSEEARDARERFGITPTEIPNVSGARAGVTPIFLGLAFKSGAEEQVIEFFDRGLPVEYELARSIRVVAKTDRKKIGVLNTEAKLFGGFDFQSMRSSPPWPVVDELKKQYEVVQVSASDSIEEVFDGLLVALPSSLPQEEMDNLLAYVKAGHPTLFLVDPLPVIDIGLSPSEKAGSNQNPFMRNQGPQPKPKGDVHKLMTELGVSWNSAQIVWDVYNPHPELAHLPPELVFVGKGNENPQAFNPEHIASKDLQEVVFLYPGYINQASTSEYDFIPLVKTGQLSGTWPYQSLVSRSFFGAQLTRPQFGYRPNNLDYTLAAQVKSKTAPADSGSTATNGSGAEKLNVMVIADLDFISQQFFEIRQRAPIENLNFDNVSFFLNCMDVLVGDESFIALRTKRVKHRTLETVEDQTLKFIEQKNQEEQDAESEAQKALAEAQQRLNERVNEVRQRTDLDEQTKQIMVRNIQEVEQRKFDALKGTIEANKDAKIQASKERMETQIRSIQNNIKTLAVFLPPIPVFALGIFIFVRRQKREREGERAARRLRG